MGNKLFLILGPIFGALFSFGFPSFWGGPIPFFGLAGYVGWWYLIQTQKSPWLYTWLFALGFNMAGFYWIPQTLQEFGDLPGWLSYFLGLFFSFIILPQLWAFLLIKKAIDKWRPLSQNSFVWAGLLAILEQIIPQQFPTHLGHVWLPLGKSLGLAPTFGAFGYSLVSFILVICLVELIINRKIMWFGYAIFVSFFTIGAIDHIGSPYEAQRLYIRIVQANIGNLLKLQSEDGNSGSIYTVIDRYKELSLRPYSVDDKKAPELIIWPETAYPLSWIFERQKNTFVPDSVFHDITKQTGAELLIGGYDERIPSNGKAQGFETDFNSAFHLSNQAKLINVFHKHILIPFGETLPFGPFNEWLSKQIPSIAFFGKGSRWTHFETKYQLKFITPICYEILLTDYIREYLNNGKEQVNFIVNLTNDSWYGNTAEPEQHLYLSKWRVLEFQIPMIRSTNTGITSVIYHDGSESKRLGIGETGVLDLAVDMPFQRATFYQRHGLWPMIGIWLALCGFQLLITKLLANKARFKKIV